MPIPKPKIGEKQKSFVNRCMAQIGSEYKDPKQALAVCFSEFTRDNAIDFDDLYSNDLYGTDIERKNYHSGRVRDPEEFQKKSFRTKKLPGSNVSVVIGRLKGQTKTTVQTYLFPKENFTPAQAKEWLKNNNVKAIKFEEAKEEGDNLDNIDAAQLNTKAVTKMKSLISSGNIDTGPWSWSEKTDGDKLLGPDGNNWTQFASVHLARNPDVDQQTKGAWGFPVGKMVGSTLTVFRRGVIAAKAAAAGARAGVKNQAVFDAASDLLEMIDKKLEKKDNADIVQRFDVIDLTEYGRLNGIEEPFRMTKEGFLTGRAVVTNIGVFPYLNQDGTIRHELRLPEEVMDAESINSLCMKPVSNEHPAELVIDTENVKKHQVGFTGSEILNDSFHISAPITITDKQAIDDVKNGKRALSAGYSLRLEEKSGTWMGVHYDAIQRNIRYNHVAIVDRGRAGDAAKIRMDEYNNTSYYISWNSNSGNNKEKEAQTVSDLKKITIDGVDYNAEAEVIKTVNGLQKQVDSLTMELKDLKTDKTKIEADRDTLKDKVNQLEKDAADEKKIENLVNRRIRILTAAEMAGISVDGKSETEIMKEVILKVSPKAALDGKDSVYVEARFDGALDQLETKADTDKTKTFLGRDPGSDDTYVSADEARKRMIKRNFDASRGIKEGGK